MKAVAALLVLLLSALLSTTATAEPYLAVAKGMHCSFCHSHPGGGGKRTVYGNAFSQTELPERTLGSPDAPLWTGELGRWFAVGGNLRAGFEYVDTPGLDESSEFGVNRATVYVEATVIPGRLSVYVDQQVGPSASINREAYVRLNDSTGKWWLAAGQFFLPYGIRLQDDSSYVRLAPGVNFDNPDRGLQVGYEAGAWSVIASVTNGSGGGNETDSGKQVSAVASYVQPGWRLGFSGSMNNADGGDREMFGVFGGIRTGPIAWLGAIDRVSDEIPSAQTQHALAGLIEANWMFRQGHNLKASYDVLDPDDDTAGNRVVRYSLVWEYSPLQYLQGRIGVRQYDGPGNTGFLSRETAFVELHGFF